jgi:hypothetical protein
MAETQITHGSFTNVASTPFYLPIPNLIQSFELWNMTQMDATVGGTAGSTAGARIIRAYFNEYLTQGTALVDQVGTYDGSVAPVYSGNLAQNGFTLFNSYSPAYYAPVAIASFTPGTTTVWTTSADHGLQVGDNVRVYSLTSAPQFGGLTMTVKTVGSSTTFTTLLDSTAATTSVGFVQKVGNAYVASVTGVYPENRVIAKITNANPMVVTTLVQQNYYVGDVVTFDIPSVFGIPQLSAGNNGLPFQATVIAANNAVGTQTVTLAVDSTSFGVFATNSDATITNPGHWPLSPGYPFGFPVMVPQGEGNINNFQSFGVVPAPLPYANQDVLSFAKQNIGSKGILIGAGTGKVTLTTPVAGDGIIGSTVDKWYWKASTMQEAYPPVI